MLRSDFITQGQSYQNETALNIVELSSGVAVNSATSALHIACLAPGSGRGMYFGPLRIHSWQVSVRGTVGLMLIS